MDGDGFYCRSLTEELIGNPVVIADFSRTFIIQINQIAGMHELGRYSAYRYEKLIPLFFDARRQDFYCDKYIYMGYKKIDGCEYGIFQIDPLLLGRTLSEEEMTFARIFVPQQYSSVVIFRRKASPGSIDHIRMAMQRRDAEILRMKQEMEFLEVRKNPVDFSNLTVPELKKRLVFEDVESGVYKEKIIKGYKLMDLKKNPKIDLGIKNNYKSIYIDIKYENREKGKHRNWFREVRSSIAKFIRRK